MNRVKHHDNTYSIPKKIALSDKMAAINVTLGLLLLMIASFVIECQETGAERSKKSDSKSELDMEQ
ncbi:hypothetical protein J6590_091334, partial [Homalodisca vitripennis]